MPYYRAALGGTPSYKEGQGINISDETISLKTASIDQFGGAKIDGSSIGINTNGQLYALKEQTLTLSSNSSTISRLYSDTIIATASAGGIITIENHNPEIISAVINNNTITITGLEVGNASITVKADKVRDYGIATATISVVVNDLHIYGVIYNLYNAGASALTRTEDATNLTDPVPYYSGIESIPSSPFDNIYPLKDIRTIEDADAGTLIEIPKFYYKLTNLSTYEIKLQIADRPTEGFFVSPAHVDRGDGIGERDYVYVGKYKCAENDFKSLSNVLPQTGLIISKYRTSIHNLGNYILQQDYAMFLTIRMLYLVEFANLDSQAKIGLGGSDTGTIELTGIMDNIIYHTGTNAPDKETGGHTIYRGIEDLLGNGLEFIDGIYTATNRDVYLTKNPANFSDTLDTSTSQKVGLTQIGMGNSWITYYKLYDNSSSYNIEGFEYAALPYMNSSYSGKDRVTDCMYGGHSSDAPPLRVGSFSSPNKNYGLFYYNTYGDRTGSGATEACGRLMVLPPSRLSPPEP